MDRNTGRTVSRLGARTVLLFRCSFILCSFTDELGLGHLPEATSTKSVPETTQEMPQSADD